MNRVVTVRSVLAALAVAVATLALELGLFAAFDFLVAQRIAVALKSLTLYNASETAMTVISDLSLPIAIIAGVWGLWHWSSPNRPS